MKYLQELARDGLDESTARLGRVGSGTVLA